MLWDLYIVNLNRPEFLSHKPIPSSTGMFDFTLLSGHRTRVGIVSALWVSLRFPKAISCHT